jgi:SlyX protein
VEQEVNAENRLIALESQVALQDDLLEKLNMTVYLQQKKIDELEAMCTALAGRVKDMAARASEMRPIDERPPHY